MNQVDFYFLAKDSLSINVTLVIRFTGSTCDSGWFVVNDSCFRVFAGTSFARGWNSARVSCQRLGSDLAVVESEIKRKIISEHLTNISNKYPDDNIKAFVGIRKFGTWHWLDGSNISASIWRFRYPDILSGSGECGFLVKRWFSLEWKLTPVSCSRRRPVRFTVCETDERKSLVMVI